MNEYQCICGRLFGHPYERTAHAATCPSMTAPPKPEVYTQEDLDNAKAYAKRTKESLFPDEPKPEVSAREWWIAFGGDPSDDKESYKRYTGAWPYTGTRIPGEDIVHVIEKSAYDAVVKERDFCKSQWELSEKKWSQKCDALAAEIEVLKECEKENWSLRQNIERLAVQLAEAKAEIARLGLAGQALRTEMNNILLKVSRGERALAYAKEGLEKWNEGCDPGGADDFLREIERLEHSGVSRVGGGIDIPNTGINPSDSECAGPR